MKLDPNRGRAHAGLARVATYLYTLAIDETPQRLQQALDESARAVTLAPHDGGVAATRAFALAAADRLTPALEEARRAVAEEPAAAEGHLALCTVLRMRRDNEGALASCRRAAALAPGEPRVLAGLGETLREAGLYAESAEMFGQSIDLDHEAIGPQLGAAATLVRRGNYPLARSLYNLLLRTWDYGAERTRLGAAALLVYTGEYDLARQMYEQVEVPEGTALPALLNLYGRAYCLRRLERDAEAEYFLSTLVERVPVDYDGPARGREILFEAYDDLIAFFRARGRDRKVTSLLLSACERPLVPTRLARALAEESRQGTARDRATGVLEKAILGSDPLEDPLELAESALTLARLRTVNGTRRLAADSPAARALDRVSERLDAGGPGAAHYRLARALALAQRPQAAVTRLGQAREAGYLPVDQLAHEPDFDRIRQDPAFAGLVQKLPHD